MLPWGTRGAWGVPEQRKEKHMSYNQAKIDILAFMLNGAGEDYFSATEACEATDLSRQLVKYHLDNFVESGALERLQSSTRFVRYIIIDKDSLIRELARISDITPGKRPYPTLFIDLASADLIEGYIDRTKEARALGIPGSLEFRQGTIEELNKAIRMLKAAKKYLINSKTKPSTARKSINTNPKDWRKNYIKKALDLRIGINEEDLKVYLEDVLETWSPEGEVNVPTPRGPQD